MKALKEQIQLKLAEKKLKKEQTIPSRPPRYDKVFFEGVRWLDSLAGEPVRSDTGVIEIGPRQLNEFHVWRIRPGASHIGVTKGAPEKKEDQV